MHCSVVLSYIVICGRHCCASHKCASLIELHDDLWQGVDGLCEADTIVCTVVDRVVQLHEDIA